MADKIIVTVCCLDGHELTKEMQPSDAVGMLRQHISAELTLDPRSFRLLSGSSMLPDGIPIQNVAGCDDGRICIQLIKFDPLLDLGIWEKSNHKGINGDQVENLGLLVKTSNSPDSNNVFLRHQIREPCFVEFHVVRSGDEMSFGVTYDDQVERLSGFSNLGAKSTWIYSKRASMSTFFFAGAKLSPEDVPSFVQGDRIAVYADPEAREVRFYKNGEFVASNIPEHPLPVAGERPLRMYAMVDQTMDEISLIRFGPGLPYEVCER